jgi:hypothetical protein
VLRYRGDTSADWYVDPWPNHPYFQGPVTALAIVDDELSGGVLTLYLYADGTIADGWNESLGDALDAIDEMPNESDGLPWADVASD